MKTVAGISVVVAVVAGSITTGLLLARATAAQRAPETIKVELEYRSPGTGPKPNFSPKGTQVPLAPVDAGLALPAGATRPALTGMIKIGTDPRAHIAALATTDAAHPKDLSRLYLDLNRNGSFTDDGPGWSAAPTQNEKTKAWWTSFNAITIQVPYAAGVTAPYLFNVWMVRDDGAAPPPVLRYSVGSWRAGVATVRGQRALVAAMDGDNNAIFDKNDYWSIVG